VGKSHSLATFKGQAKDHYVWNVALTTGELALVRSAAS
jgi:hypothetical protein